MEAVRFVAEIIDFWDHRMGLILYDDIRGTLQAREQWVVDIGTSNWLASLDEPETVKFIGEIAQVQADFDVVLDYASELSNEIIERTTSAALAICSDKLATYVVRNDTSGEQSRTILQAVWDSKIPKSPDLLLAMCSLNSNDELKSLRDSILREYSSDRSGTLTCLALVYDMVRREQPLYSSKVPILTELNRRFVDSMGRKQEGPAREWSIEQIELAQLVAANYADIPAPLLALLDDVLSSPNLPRNAREAHRILLERHSCLRNEYGKFWENMKPSADFLSWAPSALANGEDE